MKKILLSGGTGFIGRCLVESLLHNGHDVILAVHAKSSLPFAAKNVSIIPFQNHEKLEEAINSVDVVINLAGASLIGKRWSKKYKKVLYESRVNTIASLIDAMKKAAHKPSVFISASAIGYYGTAVSPKPYTENDMPGTDFLAKLCIAWEQEAQKAIELGIRTVCIRSAIVLAKEDGALPKMAFPFKLFVGGSIGISPYPFSWIHIDDEVCLITFCMEHTTVAGAINACAPEVVTNRIFAKTLARVLHRPSLFPVPSFLLRLVLGQSADVITHGISVSSEKIKSLGFAFSYPTLTSCLEDIYKKEI